MAWPPSLAEFLGWGTQAPEPLSFFARKTRELFAPGRERAVARRRFLRYVNEQPGPFFSSMRELLFRRRLGPYFIHPGVGGKKVIDYRTGDVVHIIPYTSSFKKIVRTAASIVTALGTGYGFGHAAATLTRLSAWSAMTAEFVTATFATLGSIVVPAIPAYYLGRHSALLGSLYGIGAWAGSIASHAAWVADLPPQWLKDWYANPSDMGRRLFEYGQRHQPWWHSLGRKIAEEAFRNPMAHRTAVPFNVLP